MKDRLSPAELWGAWMLFAIHVFVFPIVTSELTLSGTLTLGDAEINFACYAISAVLCFAVLGKYLRRSFDSLVEVWRDLPRSLSAIAVSVGIYLVLYLLCGLLLGFINGGAMLPNDENVLGMLDENRGVMLAAVLFLSPVVEETIFRGGVFCGLYRKSRALAYAASIALFSLYHVWQYAVAFGDLKYLLLAVAYVPAAAALSVIYEKSGTVWYCVLLHMIINFSSLSLLGIV